MELPKIIYSWWAQGMGQAPKLVKDTWNLWQNLHPDYECVNINSSMVEEVSAKIDCNFDRLPHQQQSDILRGYFLQKTGGVWVDAATIPIIHLEKWLPRLMTAGFFAFHDPCRGREIDSWFIASKADHPLMKKWSDTQFAYWHKDRKLQTRNYQLSKGIRGDISRITRLPIGRMKKNKYLDRIWTVSLQGGAKTNYFPYFCMHFLFEELIYTDDEARALWALVPKKTGYDEITLRHSTAKYDSMTHDEFNSLIACSVIQKLFPNKPPKQEYLDKLYERILETNS